MLFRTLRKQGKEYVLQLNEEDKKYIKKRENFFDKVKKLLESNQDIKSDQ